MRKSARLILAVLSILFAAGTACAQNAPYHDQVLSGAGRPVAGALISVCAVTTPGVPCSPTVQIYGTSDNSKPLTQPIQTDGYGNFSFFAPPGKYVYTISGPAVIQTTAIPFTIPCDTCASTNAVNSWSAQQNLNGLADINSGMNVTGRVTFAQLANPLAPTVTPVGAQGSTTYTYFLVCHDANGGATLPGPGGSTSAGNASLSSNNYNAISWTVIAGCATYDVLKTNTSTSLVTALAPTAAPGSIQTVNDTGQSTSAYTAPGSNTTGSLTLGTLPNFPNQNANTHFAGPSSGGPAAPIFRALVGADIPAISLAATGNGGVTGTLPGTSVATFVASGASHAPGAVPDPGASAGTTHFLREDATWATVPPSGVSEATFGWGNGVQVNLGSGAGSCTSSPIALCGQYLLPNAHTIVRFTYVLTSSPAGCTTAAVVGIRDITAGSNLTTLTVANGTGLGLVDSGALAVSTTAGHVLAIGVLTAPSGCTTSPGIISITGVFQ